VSTFSFFRLGCHISLIKKKLIENHGRFQALNGFFRAKNEALSLSEFPGDSLSAFLRAEKRE
jgi:hypothetical protein